MKQRVCESEIKFTVTSRALQLDDGKWVAHIDFHFNGEYINSEQLSLPSWGEAAEVAELFTETQAETMAWIWANHRKEEVEFSLQGWLKNYKNVYKEFGLFRKRQVHDCDAAGCGDQCTNVDSGGGESPEEGV